MPILLSLGALALGVLITFGALATDGPATAPLIAGAVLWAVGLAGVIVFAIYGRASHAPRRGQWLRTWRRPRRRRTATSDNGTNGFHGHRPIPQA
jgi:hypothetical protein